MEKEFFVQLFVEHDPNLKVPTVGELLRRMFKEQQISFKKVLDHITDPTHAGFFFSLLCTHKLTYYRVQDCHRLGQTVHSKCRMFSFKQKKMLNCILPVLKI